MTEPLGHERQALDDWFIYGPKDPEIALLVQRLVAEHGLRTAEIESYIEAGLREWLQALDAVANANQGNNAS